MYMPPVSTVLRVLRRALTALPLLLVLLLVLAGLTPAEAAGQWQGSARLGLGFGKRYADTKRPMVFTPSLRGEALRATRKHPRLRLGPAGELRTSDFDTVEGSAGLALALGIGEDAAFGLHSLIGYAHRPNLWSGAWLSQIVTFGLREWDERPRYAYGLNLFLAGRVGLHDRAIYEITGGVELDLLFFGIPFIAMRDSWRSWNAGRAAIE